MRSRVQKKIVWPSVCVKPHRSRPTGNLFTTTDPLAHATSIAYNLSGQPASVTDALGNITTFEYDAAGNLTATTDALGNRTARTYDSVSRLIAITDARGFTTQFSYDVLNRVTQITDANGGTTSFTYDPNGNLLTVTDAKNQVTTYTYDNLDRLLTRTDALGRIERYAYDKAGNLTTFTDRKGQVSTFTYDALNRRIGAAFADGSTTSFVYDAVGRLVSALDSVVGRIDFVYDNLDRLAQEVTAKGSVSYTYDALGRRINKTINGVTTSYLYDGNDIVQEIGGGAVGATYLRSLNIDEPFIRITAAGTESYHTDALGSTLALTNDAGQVTTTYTYDPFGNTQSTNPAFPNPFQFTGRENDQTGLYYYRARYYSPRLQRFLSEDPLGFLAGDFNLYQYVNDNPLIAVDPLGLDWVYSQSSGQIVHVDNQTGAITPGGTGYSGQAPVINNPAAQQVTDFGPIPQGRWTIGSQQTNVINTVRGSVQLAGSMRLTPQSGTNTFGRSGFLIHGGNMSAMNSSKGCIVLPPRIRDLIGNSGDTTLRVVQ